MKLRRPRLGLGILIALGILVQGFGIREAHAGAWARSQWGYFLQLGTSYTFANDRFLPGGGTTRIAVPKSVRAGEDPLGATGMGGANENASNLRQLNTDLYFELGLHRRFTIFGDIMFASATQENKGGNILYRASGIGDLMFGARVPIIELPVALAFEGRIYIPTANSTGLIALGPGDYRGELRFALGKAWQNLVVPVYFDLEAGATFRGTGTVRNPAGVNFQSDAHYAHEFFAHGEIGATLVKTKGQDRLLLVAACDFRRSTREINDGASFTLTPTESQMIGLSGMLMGFIWRGLGISARYTHILPGSRTTMYAGTVTGGIFASF